MVRDAKMGCSMLRTPLILGIAVMLGGCAMLTRGDGPDAEAELARGLAALRAQEYAAARSILTPVFESSWQERTGQQAALALAAAELDSRNPTRRLWAGADMAGRFLNIPDVAPEDVPVAETLYLLAVELGAQEEALARADSAKVQAEQAAAAARPRSGVQTVPARLRAVENERAELAKQVTQLTQSLRARERELAEARQELARIKKTIKIQ